MTCAWNSLQDRSDFIENELLVNRPKRSHEPARVVTILLQSNSVAKTGTALAASVAFHRQALDQHNFRKFHWLLLPWPP